MSVYDEGRYGDGPENAYYGTYERAEYERGLDDKQKDIQEWIKIHTPPSSDYQSNASSAGVRTTKPNLGGILVLITLGIIIWSYDALKELFGSPDLIQLILVILIILAIIFIAIIAIARGSSKGALVCICTIILIVLVVRSMNSQTYGSISISSVPNAAITIDGNNEGITPKVIDYLTEGSHLVTLYNLGYHEWSQYVWVEAGKTVSISPTLIKPETIHNGSIEIDSMPHEASVYLDNEYKGKTPIKLSNLQVGKHEITLRLGSLSHSKKVKVNAGENSPMYVILD